MLKLTRTGNNSAARDIILSWQSQNSDQPSTELPKLHNPTPNTCISWGKSTSPNAGLVQPQLSGFFKDSTKASEIIAATYKKRAEGQMRMQPMPSCHCCSQLQLRLHLSFSYQLHSLTHLVNTPVSNKWHNAFISISSWHSVTFKSRFYLFFPISWWL